MYCTYIYVVQYVLYHTVYHAITRTIFLQFKKCGRRRNVRMILFTEVQVGSLTGGGVHSTNGNTLMRMLVEPRGTSTSSSSAPQPMPPQSTGLAGGGSVMLLPRQNPHDGTRRPVTLIANGCAPAESLNAKAGDHPTEERLKEAPLVGTRA